MLEPIEFYVDDARADRFSSDVIDRLAYHGSLWGLPLATKALALYYRTDLVPAAPRTTDDLVALVPAMRARDGFAFAYSNVDLYGHAPWLHAFGGSVMSDDGTLAIDTREAASAMTFARALVEQHVSPANANNTLDASLFNAGRAATVMSGPWFVTDIAPGVPWAVTTLPIVSRAGRAAEPFVTRRGRADVRARARQGRRVRGDGRADQRRRAAITRAHGAAGRAEHPRVRRSRRSPPTPRCACSALSSRTACRCRRARRCAACGRRTRRRSARSSPAAADPRRRCHKLEAEIKSYK